MPSLNSGAYEVHKWNEIPEREITPLISRKVIWGKNQNLALFHLKKGCHVAAHQHISEQFAYILEGGLKFVVYGVEVTVSKGEVIRLPSNVVHEAYALEDTYDLDVFSPARDDWLRDEIDYMKKG
jgi:quercetin dioxygenase-like cupin family protein